MSETPIEGSAPRKSGPFAVGWAAAVGYARVLHRRVAPARPQRAGSNKNNAGEDAGDDEEMPSRMDTFRFGHAKHSESRVVYVTADASAHGPNAGFRFKGNAISTGKYSPITFFPKGLYEQFRRVANLYFLSVAIISLFEAISPIKPYTIWSPLVLVVGLSMAKEAVEDYARHKQDHEQNTSLTERFNGTSLVQCEWREVKTGDLVRVVRDQAFPCDLVLLASSLDDSVCYVETKNLDGETNLKIKRGVEGMGGVGTGPTKMRELCGDGRDAYVECEHPNNSLYTFTGNLDVPSRTREVSVHGSSRNLAAAAEDRTGSEKISLVPSNILLRGSSLRNTEWVIGLAIYTGHDSKIMASTSRPPYPFPALVAVFSSLTFRLTFRR